MPTKCNPLSMMNCDDREKNKFFLFPCWNYLAWFVHLWLLDYGEEEIGTMISGKVKWFSDTKGYGFIELAQGKDVFVHYSVIESDGYRSLREGQEVDFELEGGPKGDHAIKVVMTESASAELA
jgi:CspA family cold shock protein